MIQQLDEGITKRGRLWVNSYPEVQGDKGEWEESAEVFVNKYRYM